MYAVRTFIITKTNKHTNTLALFIHKNILCIESAKNSEKQMSWENLTFSLLISSLKRFIVCLRVLLNDLLFFLSCIYLNANDIFFVLYLYLLLQCAIATFFLFVSKVITFSNILCVFLFRKYT